MSDETTTEQLAEIEGQAEAQPETQPQPIQVREGRWRTRGGAVKNIRPCEPLRGAYFVWPWTDGVMTFQDNGRHQGSKESPNDLVEYLGPIEPDKTQELDGKTQELPDKTQELPEYTPPEGWRVVRFGESLQPGDVWVNQDGTEQRSNVLQWDASAVSGGRCIRRIGPQPEPVPDAAAIEELRSEVSYVQRLLGESRQRVTQLEELVTSLRNINEGAEKAVSGAGVVNDSLRLQLAAVKAELAQVSKDRYALQIELNAAQQVPADSPELRQLRADLEQVTQERDQYLDSYQRIFGDLETIRETTKAAAVEAIAEWLQAFRGCNSPALALLLLEALPSIMRSLTGLADDEDVD